MSVFDNNITNIRFRDLYKTGDIFDYVSHSEPWWGKSYSLESVTNPEYLYYNYSFRNDSHWKSQSKSTAEINHIIKTCLNDCWVNDNIEEDPSELVPVLKSFLSEHRVEYVNDIEVKINHMKENFRYLKFGDKSYEFPTLWPFIDSRNDLNHKVLHILIHFDPEMVTDPCKLISIILS